MLLLGHLLLAGLGLYSTARGITQGEQCRTEYTTVWETEYEERESHTCVTKWVPECKTVYERTCEPTTREVVS